jgi:hypothetical protein
MLQDRNETNVLLELIELDSARGQPFLSPRAKECYCARLR